MMRKPVLNATVSTGTMDYIIKIAERYNISKSAAVELISFSNECEVDMTTLDYIYTTLFKKTDGRTSKKSGE
jgi:hypothetical protein